MACKKKTVLLVEDRDQDAFLISQLLMGYSGDALNVQHVTTAADAVSYLADRPVDIVLLDLGLPDSQGFDTVLRIRTSFPSVPVVVVTGIDDDEIGIQAIECGAQDYVSKDLVAGQMLVRTIRFAMTRHSHITHYKAQARTDALTNLSNRHAFEGRLSRLISDWKSTQQQFSLLLLDVDRFKRVNDMHGHRTGDYVLSRLAQLISGAIGHADLAARFGGEEFAILCPAKGLDQAATEAAHILAEIRQSSFSFEGAVMEMTASMGVAEFMAEDDAASLIERADNALYAAKAAGRDQAYLHDRRTCQAVGPTLAAWASNQSGPPIVT